MPRSSARRSSTVLRPGYLALSLASVFAAGCAEPGADHTVAFSFPSFAQLAGGAPADRDIADDVKSDAPLPARYLDLVTRQSPVRNQGSRGVCTIFTSTALLEHILLVRGVQNPDLSEQFLQWTHKREGAEVERSEGSALGEVMDTLAARGTVDEALWPYESTAWNAPAHPDCAKETPTWPAGCATNGEPSAAARAGTRSKLAVGRFLRTSAIKDYLYTQKLPVAVGLEFVDEAWSYPPTVYQDRPGAWERGEVVYPTAKALAASALRGRSGHAVLIVGWDDAHAAPLLDDSGHAVLDAAGEPVMERGFYVVKNSWGTSYWGSQNVHGPGYGWLSQRYVAELGRAYVVGLPTGAPPAAGGERHVGGSAIALPAQGSFEDTIFVNSAGPLSQARLEIVLDHPSATDLTVELLHDNASWTLWSHGEGTTIRGTWVLNGGLDRMDRGGAWTLRITDSVTGTSGTLQSWALTFK